MLYFCWCQHTSQPERRRAGQWFNVKTSPLGSVSFWRLFKNNSKAAAAECRGSHTSLECVLSTLFKGEECHGSTCSAQCCSSCAEADKWSARPSSPHHTQALGREHEKAGRLCLPWGLPSEDQGLEAYREDVCRRVDKTKSEFEACTLRTHVLGYALEKSLDCVNRDTCNQEENKTEDEKVHFSESFCVPIPHLFFGAQKEGAKLNEAMPLLWALQNMPVTLWSNSWVFASSSRWWTFLPLMCFCSSHHASYCLIPQSSIGYSDWFRLPLPSGVKEKLNRTLLKVTIPVYKDFPVLINSCWRHDSHLSVSVCSVLAYDPKKSQTCYAATPTPLKFQTDDRIF